MTKRATNPRVSRRRRGQVLRCEDCPACGTWMLEKRGRLRLPVNGEEITVPSASHLKCPKCHEVVLPLARRPAAEPGHHRDLPPQARPSLGRSNPCDQRAVRTHAGGVCAPPSTRGEYAFALGGRPECPDGSHGHAAPPHPRSTRHDRVSAHSRRVRRTLAGRQPLTGSESRRLLACATSTSSMC
jgi:hypothetical protein